MLNNSGPSIEPCGIPVVVLVKLDLVSSKITYYFRPVRSFFIKFNATPLAP